MSWINHVRDVYSSLEELEGYDETFSIVERCGYASAAELWEANPKIQGSTKPEDFGLFKGLGRGAWVGFSVQPNGYSVRVYDPESREVQTYDAGNHRGDSQVWIDPDSPDAVDAETLKRFARQTAEEMAAEYGVNLAMVQEEEQ